MAGRAEPGRGTGVPTWLERRTGITPVINASLHVRIPISAETFYFGGITLFLFMVQAVTGTLLALYYQPTPEAAYDSVKFITSDVSFGWLIRSVHHWGANLMILFVVLHMIRIFLQAAYKYPRELVWIVGGGLFVITVGFGFTGYLLPWDQKAFWATTVGTEIAGSVPIVGDIALQMLRGGADVTGATLTRFFGAHVLVLPISLAALLALHLLMVHQLGLASRKHPDRRPERARRWRRGAVEPAVSTAEAVAVSVDATPAAALTEDPAPATATTAAAVEPAPDAPGAPASGTATAAVATAPVAVASADQPERLRPFWPNYILDELIAWYAVIAILVVLASVFPAGLEPKADPLSTPAHIKPEWYFLFLYELLKMVPRLVGVLAPIIGLGIVVLLPVLDRNPETRARKRPFALLGITLILIGVAVLTWMGMS